MKNLSVIVLFVVFVCGCKLPEIPAFKAKNNPVECKPLKASIALKPSITEPKAYNISLDTLEGSIKSIVWKINNEPQSTTARSFTYTFPKDNDFTIAAEIKDSCDKSITAYKTLKICKPIKASISLKSDDLNPFRYIVSFDTLNGNISDIIWKIDANILSNKERSFSYTFPKDGNYVVYAEIKDSCNQGMSVNKSLKVCKPLKAAISLKAQGVNPANYLISLDSLKGNITKLVWKVNGVPLTETKTSFAYSFTKDGNNTVTVELLDSCSRTLKKEKTTSINIKTVTIPDQNFEKKLISSGIDTDKTLNGKIWDRDALNATSLILTDKDKTSGPLLETVKYYDGINKETDIIKSLQGIEAFKNLETLNFSNHDIKTVNLSNNMALKYLKCSFTAIATLDLSKNISLQELECVTTNLTSLNLTSNIVLKNLRCANNYLQKLDISKNLSLEYLNCMTNNLTSLITGSINVKQLFCGGNPLTTIDLSKNLSLTYLDCLGNPFSTLDVSKNTALETLYCFLNPELLIICVPDINNIPPDFHKDSGAEWKKCN